MKTLRQKIADALGWDIEQTKTVSVPSLRDLVRPINPALAEEISDAIQLASNGSMSFRQLTPDARSIGCRS